LGVNLTFIPLHFLGLNGFPRKYTDYQDIYFLWNIVSSLGSLVRLFATILLIFSFLESFIRYRVLTNENSTANVLEWNSRFSINHSFNQTTLQLV
jgi:heme/copper-type cytochrome/quinol oxidase subunit 1